MKPQVVNSRFAWRMLPMVAALAVLLGAARPAHAQWLTQSIELKAGWIPKSIAQFAYSPIQLVGSAPILARR